MVFFSSFGFSQTREIDSLKKLLRNAKLKDSSKIDLYLALTKAFIPVNIDSTYKYSKISLKKSLIANNYKIIKAYESRGIALDIKFQSDSARFYFDKALSELDKNDNPQKRSSIYKSYSLSYQNSDRMDLALDYNSKAMALIEDNDKELGLLYFNQAILYLRSNIRESGKKYLMLAYESSKKTNDIRVEGASTQTLGYYYIEEKKLDSARIYLENGLDICKRTKSPETCFRVNSALGDLYIAMNLNSKAHDAILTAKKYAEIRNNTYDVLLNLIQLGELENKRNNLEKSVQYFKEFDNLYAKEGEDSPSFGADGYQLWSDTEYKRANYKKSYELIKKANDYNDLLFTREKTELLADADAKFETEKKEKEIAEQKLIVSNQELSIQKNKSKFRIMTILIISLLLASILLWFVFQQRQKRIQQQLVTIQKEQEVLTLESLIAGEEKERLRIAKELHDGVNGDLSAIKYKLSALLKMNNDVINEAVTMIDNSCQQVRAISHNLVPPSLKNFNLIEAINNYCENMNNTHTPDINFQYIGDAVDLNKKIEVNIFRIIQELVTNAIKHAKAEHIDVQISHSNNTILLTVEDDGKGYIQTENTKPGIGLNNIKSRVEYLNANFEIVSNTKGTSNTIEIDLNTL